ncbi:MAG TPA: hypothetical protein VLV16_09210 [Gemmatimonadales bacterium]|nr:hypothetical protein [Gemmatimonadales bacterium]
MGCVIAVGLLAPDSGAAQAVDIGLAAGVYFPIGALVQTGSESHPATFFQQRLQITPMLSGNAVVWTSDRFGIQGAVTYCPSTLAVQDSSGISDHHSSVVLASIRALYAFSPMPFKPPPGKREAPWSFYVGLGAGVVSRSGNVWTYTSGLVAPAAVFDVGVRTPLGGRSVLRINIENYLSVAQFDKGLPTETEARLHGDLAFNATFAYRLKR